MPGFTNSKIVFVGTGAIGGSLGAWLSTRHPNTFLLAHGKTGEAVRTAGITTYCDAPEQREHARIRLVDDLNQASDAGVVVLGVKLYDLEQAAQMVRAKLGDRPLVVGLQNGVANQEILPRYFSRVVYGLVCYNAWVDAPGIIGCQSRGPLVLGTPDNTLQTEVQALTDVFSPAVPTRVTNRLGDAAHCKLVFNLSNSVTTLLGLNFREITDPDLFQKILAGTIYEGVQVIRAAGYREERLGSFPSWATLWASARLPQLITRPSFQRNLKKMVVSSMGQDVIQSKRAHNELEYLNGYLLSLADRTHTPAPFNRAIYALCKEHFARPGFQPLAERDVWAEIERQR